MMMMTTTMMMMVKRRAQSTVASAISVAVAENGVATITLTNSKRHNSFSDATIAELSTALETVKTHPIRPRVLFIKSTGESFSAGADLTWMKRMAGSTREEGINDAMKLARMLKELNTFPALTVALVQGPAYGGGVGLVAACDMAVADVKAKFTLSEVKLGLIPATISPYVVGKIGPHARRYFLTAESFDAHRAKEIGLVHEVVDSGEAGLKLWEEKLVAQVLNNSPNAIIESKRLFFNVSNKSVTDDVIAATANHLADVRMSTECQQGLTAFFNKQKAPWIKQ